MPFVSELVTLLGLGFLGMLAASLARAKGRSAVAWFFIGLFVPGIGHLVLYALNPLTRTCPDCGEAFLVGEQSCPGCGRDLPDAYALKTLVRADVIHDGECPACKTPFDSTSYLASAPEWRCSRCQGLLPRSDPAA